VQLYFFLMMLKYFSPYSFLPDKLHLIEEEHEKPLKTEYIPNLKQDLKPGWLFHHLYNYDALLYGRWEYWSNLQLVPQEKYHLLIEKAPDTRLKNIQKHILPLEPIPEISFSNGCASSRDKGRQMLELCLDKMLTKGGYISMITRIEYLLDWLLFALGHPHFGELPPEPRSCKGCSMVLYQLFNLFPVMYLPKDYWGSLIADAKSKGSQRHTGYFPTPNTVANAIGQMLFCPEQDTRLQVGYEPTVGTGVMTLEPSNRILCMIATDVDKVLLKATLVNWYLYCLWFAMPPFYLIDRTDLMWGNSLAEPDRENAPVSIHQKYWLEQYRDIYPVGLVEQDWREEIQKIIDLQPALTAPKIQQPKIEDDLIQPDKPTKPKGFKRAKSKKKLKSLF
jgi:hypothetical protein